MPVSNTFQLAYRADLNILVGRWLSNYTLAEAQTEYEGLLAAEETTRTTRWLLDIRRAPTPPPELANWITYNWLPRAASRLAPSPLRLAYLLSPLRADAVRTDAQLHATVHDLLVPAPSYHTALFIDEGAAMSWLLG